MVTNGYHVCTEALMMDVKCITFEALADSCGYKMMSRWSEWWLPPYSTLCTLDQTQVHSTWLTTTTYAGMGEFRIILFNVTNKQQTYRYILYKSILIYQNIRPETGGTVPVWHTATLQKL